LQHFCKIYSLFCTGMIQGLGPLFGLQKRSQIEQKNLQ
jgi:hypothetical protein